MINTSVLTEKEIQLAYRTYCLKMLTMDIEDVIDAEELDYDQFKERLITERS